MDFTEPDLFDAIAQHYDFLYAERDDDLDAWLELLQATGPKVLEVGCGTGRLTLPLASAGFHLTGVDISAQALALARQKLQAQGLEQAVKLYQADMRNLNLPETQHHTALIPINTFMHCLTQSDQLATLRSVRQHLHPQGQLIVDLYHPHPQLLLESDGRLELVSQGHNPQNGHLVQWFSARRTDAGEQTQTVTFLLDEVGPQGNLQRHTLTFPMRYVHRFEMELLLTQSGFHIDDIFGDYDLMPFYEESPRLIFVASPHR